MGKKDRIHERRKQVTVCLSTSFLPLLALRLGLSNLKVKWHLWREENWETFEQWQWTQYVYTLAGLMVRIKSPLFPKALLSVHLTVSITMCRLVFAESSRQAQDPRGVCWIFRNFVFLGFMPVFGLFTLKFIWFFRLCFAVQCLHSDGAFLWRNWM